MWDRRVSKNKLDLAGALMASPLGSGAEGLMRSVFWVTGPRRSKRAIGGKEVFEQRLDKPLVAIGAR